MNRRRFLALGAGGALAASWDGAAMAQQPPPRRVKSVILLWMGGGQSQIETWDPKPGSPNAAGVKAIDTKAPGIRISDRLPRTAAVMDRVSIVRSVSTEETQPALAEYLMHCGIYPNCADSDVSLGTILAYELWGRLSGAPPYVTFNPPRIPVSDVFGSAFLPVEPDVPGTFRVTDGAALRRALLRSQEEEWTASHVQKSVSGLSATRAEAERRSDSGWMQALDVTHEPEQLRASYGPGFGLACLRARRLLRAGVAVVEIGLAGWDQPQRVPGLCAEFDAGFGTLIRDLADKDLLRDTVVLCWGPHGRSPKPGEGGKRPPWASGFSVAVAGGSLAGGRVVGETGNDGDACDHPVPAHDLFATIYAACGIDGNKTYSNEGRRIKYVSKNGSASTSGAPLKALF